MPMISQVISMLRAVMAEKYRSNVNMQKEITVRSATVMKLVDTGGLSLLLSVGINATTKPIWATAMT